MRERFAYTLLALTTILIILGVLGGSLGPVLIGGGGVTILGLLYVVMRWLFPKNQ